MIPGPDGKESGAETVSATLLSAVMEHAGLGVAVVDSEGRFVIANAALCAFLGYAKAELRRLTERSVTHGQDVESDAALFQELFAGIRTRYTIDKRYVQKSGSVVWAHVTVTLLREPSGDLAIAIVEDITEKRNLEEASREVRCADERYALVSRATNDVIWDWDAEHGTIVWNDALRRMFGYEPDQIDNRLQWWDTHLHPDDRERVVSGINSIIEQGGSSWTDEYRGGAWQPHASLLPVRPCHRRLTWDGASFPTSRSVPP